MPRWILRRTFKMSDTTQEFCDNSGGVWNQATSCDDSPCQESFVEETGACCLPNGSCQENVTQSFCEGLMSGEWQGSDTTCNGAGCGGEAEESGDGFGIGSGGLGD